MGEAVGPNEETTPWIAIASLGLFKLFNDWQAQGVQLPVELLPGPLMRAPAAQLEADGDAAMLPSVKVSGGLYFALK